MAKICTVGSATQDIFLLTEGAETMHLHLKSDIESYLIVPQGTKIDVPDLHYAIGGGATNTAVGMSRLGHRVEAYFCIGNDTAGEEVRQQMLKEAVSITHIQIIDGGHTATSFIIPSIEKNHVVFVHRGVNKQLSAQNFPIALLKELDYLYLCPLSGTGKELLAELAPAAKKLNVPIIANPGMGQLAHNPQAFIEQLSHIDCLILNAHEASVLLHAIIGNLPDEKAIIGNPINRKSPSEKTAALPWADAESPKTNRCQKSKHHTPALIRCFVRELLKHGPSLLVITNGTEGVYVATKDTLYFHPSLHVQPVSSLGAGDAFGSGFIAALAHKKSLEEAILYGVINASSVIQCQDAQEGLLRLDEIEKRARKQGLDLLNICKIT